MTCVTYSKINKRFRRAGLACAIMALATAGGVFVETSAVFAQNAAPTPTAPAKPVLQKQPAAQTPTAPAPAKGAPAQSSSPAAQADAPNAPPDGPIKVDLQPTAAQWTKVCGKDQGNNKQVCYTTRDFGQDANQPPILAIAVYELEGEEKRIVRFLMPIGLMLKPGFRMNVDQGQPIAGAYAICLPNGCFAEAEVSAAFITQLKKTSLLTVAVRNQVNNEVTFTMPMKEFAKAFDGPPIDPEVLKQQAQELQQKLEEQAKAQREQLEKQQGQPSQPLPGQLAPPVAPAPGTPPKQ